MRKELAAALLVVAVALVSTAAPSASTAAVVSRGTTAPALALEGGPVVYPVYGEPAVYSNRDDRGGVGVRGAFVVTGAPDGTVAYQYAVVPGTEAPADFPEEHATVDAEPYTVIPVVPELPGRQQLLVRPVSLDGTPGSTVRRAYDVAGPGEEPTTPEAAARVDRLPIDLTEASDATALLRVRMSGELFTGAEDGGIPHGEVVVRRGDAEIGRADVLSSTIAVEVAEDSLGTGSESVRVDYHPYPGAGPVSQPGTVCLHECLYERAWSRIYGGPTLEARVASVPAYTSLSDIQWFRDGEQVPGETEQLLVTGPPDVGHGYRARVTVHHPRMVPVTVNSPELVQTREPRAGIRYFVKETNILWNDGDGDMWQVDDGETSGTTDPPARNESVSIRATGDYHLIDTYAAHVPGRGWIESAWHPELEGWHGAEMAGTFQEDLDLDAYRVSVDPEFAGWYDVYYRSYVAPFGWLGWARNGQTSGTTGYGFDVSAVQMVVREKTEAGPRPSHGMRPAYLDAADQNQIWSNAYQRDIGWSGGKPGGYTAGSTDGALEGLRFSLAPQDGEGGVSYRALVHGRGWTAWMDGGTAGSPDVRLIEAYQLRLTGEIAERYDLYARSYVGGWGWLGWAKNGAASGSSGYDRALRATQVILVPKGQPWPTGSGLPRTYVR